MTWQKPARVLLGTERVSGPSMLCVRPVERKDIDELFEIEQASYPFPWSRGNFIDSLVSDYDFICLLGPSGKIGYAIGMWLPQEMHLLNITVTPAWQHQGLGRRFLLWLIEDAKQRGANSLMLEVRPSNVAALALYTKMGFAQIGVRKAYYPSFAHSREDALVLSLSLISSR